MKTIEVKFLYDGIIFSSQVLISRVSNSLNKFEFFVSFFNRYLISKFSDNYIFVLEDNKFKPVYTKDEKEVELIKTLQDAIIEISHVIKQKLLPG